jgi:hypothetical protein
MGAPELLALFGLIILALFAVGWWSWMRVFARAGYPAWHSLKLLVPFYNLFIVCSLNLKAGYSTWWGLLLLVPFGWAAWGIKLAYVNEWPAEAQARLLTALANSAPEGQ